MISLKCFALLIDRVEAGHLNLNRKNHSIHTYIYTHRNNAMEKEEGHFVTVARRFAYRYAIFACSLVRHTHTYMYIMNVFAMFASK